MKALVVLALLVFMIPIGINSAFALSTYTINIPTGAASPEAPYFWASEKDGNTDGVIIVEKFDIVQWGNADTLPHTVTSGTVPSETDDNGPDGIFDSGLFYRGDYFRYQFNEVGDYPYFCLVHPWMEGVVHVVGSSTSGVQTIFGVGSDAGDGQTAFSLDYILDRNLASITVDETSKSLTLILSGKSFGDELTIMLPEDLIKNPNAVWIDDVQVTNFPGKKKIPSFAIIAKCDSELLHRYHFEMIAKDGIFFLPGKLGAISNSHSQSDVKALIEASNLFRSKLSNWSHLWKR